MFCPAGHHCYNKRINSDDQEGIIAMPKILFVDNTIDHSLYRPLEHFRPLFILPYEVYHAPSAQSLPDLDLYSHLLLSGSFASTLDHDAWILSEMELIREAVRKGKVILGSCFGHQLIARSLFGLQAVRKREKPQIGWLDLSLMEDDRLLGKKGEQISGFFFHFDEVSALPETETVTLLASSASSHLAYHLKNMPVWGIQPHYELGVMQGFALIGTALAQGAPGVPPKENFIASTPHRPRDSAHITRIMAAFQEQEPQ
jgi:GMP synthase-like glutamine amidotransferase